MERNMFELGRHTEAIDGLKRGCDDIDARLKKLCIEQKTLTGEITLTLKAMRETADLCKEKRVAAELDLCKKLDNHINIDHFEVLEYANWFCAIKRHSIKIIIFLITVMINMLFPEYSYGYVIDVLKKIFT